MSDERPARRVLLGISGSGEVEPCLELAVGFAQGTGAILNCLLVERDEILAASQLPIMRIVSHGGFSSSLTPEYLASHLRRMAHRVEDLLVARCSAAGIDWTLERPRGEYLREILSVIEEGDVVVLDHADSLDSTVDLAHMTLAILDKASAVVVPGAGSRRAEAVVALLHPQDEGSAALARSIAGSLGLSLRLASSQEFPAHMPRDCIYILELEHVRELGGVNEVRRRLGRSATLVILHKRR